MFLAVKEHLNVINKAHSSIVHVSNSSCTNDKCITLVGIKLTALCGTGLECCDFKSIQTCKDDKKLVRDRKSPADSLCLGQLHFYLIAGYF